jgi:CRISPR-associated protein Cmr2
MTHLFLFTIGPVQSFIAQARKTRDLYAGSQILSELVTVGMDAFSGTVIFPDKSSQSKPNRFLGWIEHIGDDKALRAIGKEVEAAVREAWKGIADKAVEGLAKPAGYDEQIENALQIFWAFQPVKEAAYHVAYRNIERTMGAIKNVRPLRQYHYQQENQEMMVGERGRKCSLDGERNVKFYRMGSTDRKGESHVIDKKLFLSNHQEVTIIRDQDGVGMGDLPPGEGLSAVSWVKRRFQPGQELQIDFESTADIALLDVKRKLHTIATTEHIAFRNEFNGNSAAIDGQLYFEENLTSSYFQKQGLSELIPKLPAIQKRHAALKKKLKDHQLNIFPYYALLLFDGDSMGKWLSGANRETGYNQGDPLKQFHINLAEYLGTFSQNAFKELNDDKGRAIYAGGDDFLGFVNLEHLYEVLDWMRAQFNEQINQQIEHKKVLFTFSAGLVIAHYKTPLHVVLDWARATEKSAKKYIHPHGQRKDTLGVSVLRASGEITQAFVPWNLEKYGWNKDTSMPVKLDEKHLCTLSMKELTESLRKDFSDKWLRSLASEFSVMQAQEGKLKIEQGEADLGSKMVKAELKRLLVRACSSHGNERDEAVQKLLPHLHSLLGPKPSENFGNFINALLICDFVERQTYGLGKPATANQLQSETNYV